MARETGKSKRAITVYFNTALEKQAFDKAAVELGFTASKLGAILVRAAIDQGMIDGLRKAMPPAVAVLPGVKSKATTTRRKLAKKS